VTHLHGIVLDITERKQRDLQRLQSRKMEAAGVLAGGIAHDFNNLLTAIYGYTELARASLPADHEAVEPLRMVEQAASQASGVTRSLLAFSHEPGSHKQAVNLVDVTRGSLGLLRDVLPPSVHVVEEYAETGELWVWGDAAQLQQVLMSLVVNARDAMPEGGRVAIGLCHEDGPVDPACRVAGECTRGVAVLTVSDSGEGMSLEVQARMFDPFFTTKPRGQGAGLGLAVTHGIVMDHGGRVEVASAPGCGTTVCIRLPCCEPGQGVEGSAGDRVMATGRGETLLVVADDDHVRAIVASSLRPRGYAVLQARDGVDAMQRLRESEGRIRLVILDLDRPRAGEPSYLGQIRAAGVRVPVVVTTGSRELVMGSSEQDNVHVLRKPFQMAELAALIRRVLSGSRHPVGERV
jgi:nitrogen-specific signal transduction histidine kinase/CheY-like chemotaxis protein